MALRVLRFAGGLGFRLDLRLDLLLGESGLAFALVEHAADEADVVLNAGNHDLLERVHAAAGLLDFLADAAQFRLGRGDLDDRLEHAAEVGGGLDGARTDVDRAEVRLRGAFGHADARHLHAVQVVDLHVDLVVAAAGEREALDGFGAVPGFRAEEAGVRALADAAELLAGGEGVLDEREEFADEGVTLTLEEVRAAGGGLQAGLAGQQGAAGGADLFCHVYSPPDVLAFMVGGRRARRLAAGSPFDPSGAYFVERLPFHISSIFVP